jgi:hypothetical protein
VATALQLYASQLRKTARSLAERLTASALLLTRLLLLLSLLE